MKSRWSTPGEAHAYESGYIEGREDARQWFLDTNLGDTVGRQKAIDTIMEEPSELRYPVYYAEKIRRLPSADVVEVVRCMDCKWYDIFHPYGTVMPDAFHCKMNDRFYDTNHYCAYGERRD